MKIYSYLLLMPEQFGGTDITLSRYDGANWSAPINLEIASIQRKRDVPTWTENLYFCPSADYPGLSELDIFYTQLEGLTLKRKIINVGAPINSNRDDFGMVACVVSSDRLLQLNRSVVERMMISIVLTVNVN
jgi:hypothetical protein